MATDFPPFDGSAPKTQKFSGPPEMGIDTDKRYTATLDTSLGEIVIALDAGKAPKTVNNFVFLALNHYYDGVIFHRIIKDFLIQGGDPTGTGTSGSDKPNLQAEFSREPHVRGVCSMARTSMPHSANSQFFICLDDATFLDGQYTVWGEVVEGMDAVDALPKGGTNKILKREIALPEPLRGT